MKNLRLLLIPALLLSPLSPGPAHAEGSTLRPCQAGIAESSPLAIAVGNVTSFGYVHHALNSALQANAGAEACFEGLALSKNIYQYYEFLIRIRVQAAGTTTHEFYLIFQDASTQAHHNVGPKPWVGLSRSAVEDVFAHALQETRFLPSDPSGNPMDQAKRTPIWNASKNARVENTLSIFTLPKTEGFLVSWMNRGEQSDNPFAAFESPKGVFLRGQEEGDQTWLTSLVLFPLEAEAFRLAGGLSQSNYAATLLDLAEVK